MRNKLIGALLVIVRVVGILGALLLLAASEAANALERRRK